MYKSQLEALGDMLFKGLSKEEEKEINKLISDFIKSVGKIGKTLSKFPLRYVIYYFLYETTKGIDMVVEQNNIDYDDSRDSWTREEVIKLLGNLINLPGKTRKSGK